MNMVTQFNMGDMISFGNYLLSKGRIKDFEATQSETSGTLEDRLGQVFAGDFHRWKAFKESQKLHDKECKARHTDHPLDVRCTCHRKDGKFDLGKSGGVNEREIMETMERMCEQSLSPDVFEKWESVRGLLKSNRQQLKSE